MDIKLGMGKIIYQGLYIHILRHKDLLISFPLSHSTFSLHSSSFPLPLSCFPSPPFLFSCPSLLTPSPQVHIFSYQCSQLSTPESVIEVFNTAKRFQRNQDTSKYVSVVVLDEVGLAEDSPNLPLKALHPLLEDGTEGADEKQEVGAFSASQLVPA